MSDPVRRARLLAPGATKREIAIHDADAAIEDIDARVPQRVGGPDIAAVPVEFLAYRAWARSVDVYDPLWPEGVRRAVIVAAPLVHATKGSLDSVEKALAALQVDTVITEWWQTEPRGVPGTFQIRALARARLYEGPILDDRLIATAYAAVMKTKPLSRAFAFSVGVVLPAVGGIVPVATGMTRAGRGVSFRLPPEDP